MIWYMIWYWNSAMINQSLIHIVHRNSSLIVFGVKNEVRKQDISVLLKLLYIVPARHPWRSITLCFLSAVSPLTWGLNQQDVIWQGHSIQDTSSHCYDLADMSASSSSSSTSLLSLPLPSRRWGIKNMSGPLRWKTMTGRVNLYPALQVGLNITSAE